MQNMELKNVRSCVYFLTTLWWELNRAILGRCCRVGVLFLCINDDGEYICLCFPHIKRVFELSLKCQHALFYFLMDFELSGSIVIWFE